MSSVDSFEGVTAVTHLDRIDYADRLRNCLRAIRAQSFDQQLVDINVGFLFRDESHVEEIKAVAREFDANVVAMANRFPQTNRSLARNLGARRSKRRAVMFVDVDTVLHPLVFEVAYPIVSAGFDRASGKRSAYFSQFRMPQSTASEVYRASSAAEFEESIRRYGEKDAGTLGNFMVETEVVHRLRGFDERFYGWGAEDTEFANRLARHDCHPLYCSFADKKLFNMHQYHPPFSGRRDNRMFSRNNSILLNRINTRKRTVVNEHFWGGAPASADVWEAEDPWSPERGNDLFGPFDPQGYIEQLDLCQVTCRVGNRTHRAFVPRAEKDFLVGEIFEARHYELPPQFSWFKPRCIVDVGANVGLYTIYAHLRYPEAFITSYEPVPPVAGVLYRNTAAIGDKCDVVMMGLGKHEPVDVKRICVSHQAGLTSTQRYVEHPTRHSVEIFLSSGRNAVLHKRNNVVDILKIDTEGSELDILKAIGADRLGRRVRFLVVEYHGDVHKDVLVSLGESFERVKRADGGRINVFVNRQLVGEQEEGAR